MEVSQSVLYCRSWYTLYHTVANIFTYRISDAETQIGGGLIEEVIQVAEGELKLVGTMLESKVYVHDVLRPVPVVIAILSNLLIDHADGKSSKRSRNLASGITLLEISILLVLRSLRINKSILTWILEPFCLFLFPDAPASPLPFLIDRCCHPFHSIFSDTFKIFFAAILGIWLFSTRP